MSTDKNNKTVYPPGLPSTSISTDESTLVTPASAEALYNISSSSTAHAPYGLQPTTVDVVTGLPQNSATTQTWSLPTFTTTPVWLPQSFNTAHSGKSTISATAPSWGFPDVLDYTF
ncbi:hypothetical protein DPMN_143114 [Dreissena polymorpha]|uniref:Uncharacterized protein n=1 Tax=Dreissena polymorpha TaxID=45954 RepID=A0A9D4JLE4_DREPO|nr:hypothetical protein DPMN_143114 [Dreissena polymorpha]